MMLTELLKLTPFYLSQVLYWIVAYIPTDQPGLWTAFVKCLPVATLVLYLQLSGVKNAQIRSLMLGMVFSNIGDFFLVFKEYFIVGMLAFAIAQINFIRAFRFQPVRPIIGMIILLLFVGVLSLLLPNIDEVPIKIGFPLYSCLLGTMGWRAIARMDQGVVEALTGLGAILFMISDACIGINLFYYKLDHAQEIIMSTYYLAQFLIVISGSKIIVAEKNAKKR